MPTSSENPSSPQTINGTSYELKVQPRSLIVLRSPREAPPLPSGAATTHRA